jgi:hypothetical protein
MQRGWRFRLSLALGLRRCRKDETFQAAEGFLSHAHETYENLVIGRV